MEDGADEKRMAGFLPVVPLVERAFGIDEHVGDVLHVAHLPVAAAHLEQRVVGGRLGVGRVEQEHPAVLCAEAGSELPVLTLDVVNDGGAWPGQKRGHDEADALAGSGGRETENVLGTVVTEIVPGELAEDDAVGSEQTRRLHFAPFGPARRAVCLDVLRLAGAPDGHADGDGDGDEAPGRRDVGAFDEDRRRIGVVEVPPPEEGRRIIDRPARQIEPGGAELGLESKPPGRPLRRRPGREEHDQEDGGDLAPEDLRRGHEPFRRW